MTTASDLPAVTARRPWYQSIAGNLLTADGGPARGADVRLWDAGGHALCWTTTAAGHAGFSLSAARAASNRPFVAA